MNKAKFLGFDKYDKKREHAKYLYRGEVYSVAYNGYNGESAGYQHRLAQSQIDEALDNPQATISTMTESADESLRKFFDSLEDII